MGLVMAEESLGPWKQRPKDTPDPYCRHCGFKRAQCHCTTYHTVRKAPGKGKPQPRLTSGDIAFASWILNYLCDHPGAGSGSGDPPKFQIIFSNSLKMCRRV